MPAPDLSRVIQATRDVKVASVEVTRKAVARGEGGPPNPIPPPPPPPTYQPPGGGRK